MILLDTHTLIWLFRGDRQLGAAAREHIDRATVDDQVHVASISGWEAEMLTSKGRLDLGMPVSRWFAGVRREGVHVVDADLSIAIEAGGLGNGLHGDPCDRLIIATARHLRCPLATADEQILAYAVAGHLQAIDARI